MAGSTNLNCLTDFRHDLNLTPMKQIQTTLIDDKDGTPADQTLLLALDGVSYELDLSNANAEKLRKSMKPWIDAGRRVAGRKIGRRQHTQHADLNAIREWARNNGKTVATRGRISAAVIEAFKASEVPAFSAKG